MTALVAILSLGIVVPAWAKTPSQTIGDSFKILSTSKTFEFTGSVEYKKTVDKKWLKLKKNAEYAQFWKDSSTKIKLSGAWDAMEESKVKFKLAVEPANADGWTYNSVKFNSFNIMTVGKMFYFLADVNFNGETLNTGSFDINKIVNNWVWVEMSSSSVSEFSGLYNSKYAETAAKVSGQNDFDAAQFKEIIKLYNYYRPFKIIRLADGKIGGKVAQHFRLTVNANGLKNFIRQANKKISGLSLSVSDLKQIDETIAGIRNASVDFWLNKKSGTLLQMSLKNTATQKSTKYSPAITVVLKMTVNFTSIGEPVNIEEPNYSFKLEDVIKEAAKVTAKGYRTLITTLTKRMAEDLSDFLKERGIKVNYLHSEVLTLERSDILQALRLGEYDVIVGINLLREGLDLPEVSLVAILDADKEGFLRSRTSLIQTMGRAARHINGTVIMYADNMTGSMKSAIGEVQRRRKVQAEYNKKHGITPRSITKPMRERLIEKIEEETGEQVLTVEDIPVNERERIIKNLEEQMKLAAEGLDFELAAKLRDQIKELNI